MKKNEQLILKLLLEEKLSPLELSQKSQLDLQEVQKVTDVLQEKGLVARASGDRSGTINITQFGRSMVGVLDSVC